MLRFLQIFFETGFNPDLSLRALSFLSLMVNTTSAFYSIFGMTSTLSALPHFGITSTLWNDALSIHDIVGFACNTKA